MESKQHFIQLLEEYLNNANDEDKKVMESILTGLLEKQSGQYKTYLAGLTQIQSQVLPNGDFEMTIPIQPLIYNPLRMVHGGITATLLDTTLGTAVTNHLPDDLTVVTSEIKVNYLKPGVGKHLRCVAKMIHRGKHLCVAEAKVYSDKDEIIASGSGTFFIVKKPT